MYTGKMNGLHYAVGSGGVVAICAGIAGLGALSLAGVDELESLMGASGGAIPASLRAMGYSATELMHMGLEEDFGKHISIKGGVFESVTEIRRSLSRLTRLAQSSSRTEPLEADESWSSSGIFGTSKLGKFIQCKADAKGLANSWPKNFCTVATLKDGSLLVFRADGIFLIRWIAGRSSCKQLSKEPAPLQLAIRASCAIPGVMTAIDYMGMLLFDGALSRDGLCPVGFMIRHFGVKAEDIVACRVGEDASHYIYGRTQRTIRRIWMVHPDYHWGSETTGATEFRPPIDHIHSLKFQLSRDEKWLAILIALMSGLEALAFRGILHGDRLLQAQELSKELGYWRNIVPAVHGERQLIANRVEKVMNKYGLF